MKRWIHASQQSDYELARLTDDAKLLAQLAVNSDPNVRWVVAKRTDDPKLLWKLADDQDMYVRQAVASNTNDPELLSYLAQDNQDIVRNTATERMDDFSISASSKQLPTQKNNELPDGYLRTTRFTTPSIKTDAQRNALEAFELAVSQKFKQFDDFMTRQIYLTSDTSWSGVIEEYPEGYYVKLEGTRSGFQAFVQGDSVIRKPTKLSPMSAYYEVNGNAGTVYWMSRRKGEQVIQSSTDEEVIDYLDVDDDSDSSYYDADPYEWYYSLPGRCQAAVDKIAEEWKLPSDADQWTLEEMHSLMHAYDNIEWGGEL